MITIMRKIGLVRKVRLHDTKQEIFIVTFILQTFSYGIASDHLIDLDLHI